MADLESSLYALLVADGTLAALVSTRVYPVVLPQDASLPAVVYQRISRVGTLAHDGPSGIPWGRVQFSAIGASYSQAKAVIAAIRGAVDGISGTYSGLVIESARVDNEIDGYDRIGGVTTIRLDVVFTWQE